MGAGASAKNKAQTRSEMREQIKNLRSVAEPLTFIVDQGGGSFRAYLFSGLKQIIRIKSVNAWEKLFSKANLAAFKENVDIDLINTSDGTFNDYSTTSPSHYKHICDSLATSYELSFIELCKTTKIVPESVSTKIVRQTGKIRTVLHTQKEQGNTTNFDAWNSEFTKRLGPAYDYKLLSNEDEAMLESSAFFELNDDVDESFIGVGMGSSSTQVYGNDGKNHYCHFDSFCGCKPGKDQAMKKVEDWVADFSALFKEIVRTDKQTTVVLLNAIGYIYIQMTKVDYAGKDEFMPKLKGAEKVNPQNLLKWTTSYAAAVEGNSEHEWSSNLLLGLAQTLASNSQFNGVYCERKGPVGKSLHFDTSWSKYLILKKSREKLKREAAMKAPTGPFTDEERNQYKKEIINLQAYVIGNVTQVLTCQQVQVLSGKKWQAKILGGKKSPKDLFMELKNEEGVITRDQWEEHCSSIASLSNTEAAKAAAGAE